nr:peptidoglycan-binding protein [Rhodospirillales bacterium]
MISRNQHRTDIWPGFVDALAALLMVIIFLLMVFVIAQFFLNDALTGRDEALERLQVQVSDLADLLSLERQTNEELRASTAKLSDELQASISISDGLKKQVKNLKLQAKTAEELAANLKNELALSLSNIGANEEIIESQLTQINALRNDVESLKALREELEEKVTQLLSKVSNKDEQLITEKKLSQTARAQIALLNKQVTALRKQILQIANILEASEKIAKQRRVKIANLGKRLNAALASKVQELARYRSEFFGRLRDVLGSQPGIRIVGDRFVFQSEVLFSKGSDQLENEGQ